MISKEITICINPGVECKKIHVDWIGIEGLIKPCVTPNCITIAIDPNNPSQCLEGFIVCLDENNQPSCKNCEAIHFKKCFCSLDSDCGDCGKCGSDGICIDICSPTETAQGKICYPDGCKCPPNKPILDPKTGKCAQCVSGSVDPKNPCRICVDGEWITKKCGDNSVCDQSTGDCITDCSKNTDGRTFWNPETKSCDCEKGYRWSTVKNKCVVDEECPEGYRRNPITDECEKIECPPGKVYNPATDECEDKPCEPKNCESGLDCEKNCGCGPDKKCVNCKDNPNALGCKDNEDECKREYCDDENPCKGINCTCHENKCVNCNNFPCDKCGQKVGCKCSDNANCEGTSDSECKDELKVEMKDCSLKTELKLHQSSCNCSGIGASARVKNKVSLRTYPSPGSVLNTIVKHIASFEIDLRDKFSNNTTGYELLNRFKESSTDINNNFPDSASCTIEITAFYKDRFDEIFSTPVQTLTSEIKSGTIGSRTTVVNFENVQIGVSSPIDIHGIPGWDDTVVAKMIGYQVSIYVGDVVFNDKGCSYERTRIYRTLSTTYESLLDVSDTYRYLTIASLSSDNKRNPLLTVKRDGEVIRKLYITPTSPGIYDDYLHGPKKLSLVEKGIQNLVTPKGELISLKDYTFEWDCGCDRTKTIKSLVKCDIKEFLNDKQFKITTSIGSDVCHNQIVLLAEHTPCPINQDLEYFGWGANHPSQTKYIVDILDIDGNTTSIGTFLYKNTTDTTGYFRKEGTNEQFVNFTYTHTKQIVSASIRMNHDGSCIKSDSVNLTIKEANILLKCLGSTVTADITSNGTLIKKVEIPELNIESVTNNSGTSIVTLNNLPENTDITFVITYLGECKRTQTLKKNCCDSDGLILNTVGTVNKQLTVKTQNNAIITDILINGITKFSDFVLSGSTYSISTSDLGNPISVDVITQTLNGCTFSVDSFNLGTNYEIVFELMPNIICTGSTSVIQISSGPPNTTVIVRDPNNNQIFISLDNTGSGISTPIDIPGNYDIIQIGTETIALGSIPTRTLTVQTNIVVDSIALETPSPGGICANMDYNFIVIGTLGANVELIATAPGYNNTKIATLTTPVSGFPGKGFDTVSYNFSVPGTYTIESGLGTLSGCQTATTESISVTVNTAPYINSVTSNCVAPVQANSDVNITVTLAPYTGTMLVTAKDLTTNSIITLTNPSISTVFTGVIPQGSGKNIEVKAQSGSCINTTNYSIPTCACTYTPPAPVFPNYFFCTLPSETISPTNSNPFNFNANVIDLYFNTTLVKTLTASDSSYQVLSVGDFGTYTAITRHVDSGCTSIPTTFTVQSGELNVELGSSISTYCSGSTLPLEAVVTGSGNLYGLLYKWFRNGVEIPGETHNVFNYVSTDSDIPSVTISVEVRRQGTTSGAYNSATCMATDSRVLNFMDCCPTLTLTYDAANSSQCDGIAIDVVAESTANPTSLMYYEVYQPASSTTPIHTGTFVLSFGMPNIPKNVLIPGNNQYRVRVGFQSSNPCFGEITFNHNSGIICEDINYIFVLDASAYGTVAQRTAIENQITYLSTQIHSDNNQAKFGLANISFNGVSDQFTIVIPGQTSPISSFGLYGAGGGTSLDIQGSMTGFDINDFTGLDLTKETKIFYFVKSTGVGDNHIGSTPLSYTASDNVLPGIGANYVTTLMPYSTTDVIKSNHDSFVIRYPHGQNYPFVQLGPYPTLQALTDAMYTQLASPSRFFAGDFTSNAALLDILDLLGCNC